MTPPEAKRVLGYMLAAWPNHKFDDLSAVVWADHLATLDAVDATHTAKTLVSNNEYFPTIHQFLETHRTRLHHQHNRRHELDNAEPRLPPDEVRRRIAALKALLSHAGRAQPDADPQDAAGGRDVILT